MTKTPAGGGTQQRAGGRGTREWFLRSGFFVVGLFVMAFGVALTTRAHLGTSPISAPPWVFALNGGWTFGQYTFAMHVLMVLSQMIMLRRRYKLIQLTQLPIGVMFGMFIDASMWLLQWADPADYWLQFIQLILGAVILGIGVRMQVAPRIFFLAGEGTIVAITEVTGWEFARVKIAFDVSLVAIGVIFSFIFFGTLLGIREGTIISAFLVGWVAGFAKRPVEKLLDWTLRSRTS